MFRAPRAGGREVCEELVESQPPSALPTLPNARLSLKSWFPLLKLFCVVCGFGIRFILLISKKRSGKPTGKVHYFSAFWHKSFRDGIEDCFSPPLVLCSHIHSFAFFKTQSSSPQSVLTCNWFAPPLKKKKSTVSWRRTRQVEEPGSHRRKHDPDSPQSPLSDPGHRWQRTPQPKREKSSLKSLHSEIPLKHTFVCLLCFSFYKIISRSLEIPTFLPCS